VNLLETAAAISLREQVLIARASGYARPMVALPDKLGAIGAAAAVFGEFRAPYALIGGLAVGVRSGVPRATLDVHFAIATTVDRQALARLFEERGFRRKGEFSRGTHFEHANGEPVRRARTGRGLVRRGSTGARGRYGFSYRNCRLK
jgi:hypothetical protein